MKNSKPKTGRNLKKQKAVIKDLRSKGKIKQVDTKQIKKAKPVVKKTDLKNKTVAKSVKKKEPTKSTNKILGGSGSGIKIIEQPDKKANKAGPPDQRDEVKKQREITKNQLELKRLQWEMAVESGLGKKDRVNELYKSYNELSLKTQDAMKDRK
ncbi:hypothetical protein M0R19_04715 [Candidatus Pacearchaeota archaeon]|jgi:hypothetical protein|nr:hypothetical protein [Candidatus Pacearchaeota archaeon]